LRRVVGGARLVGSPNPRRSQLEKGTIVNEIISMLESISGICSSVSNITSDEGEAEVAWNIHLELQDVLRKAYDLLGVVEAEKESELLAIEASLT